MNGAAPVIPRVVGQGNGLTSADDDDAVSGTPPLQGKATGGTAANDAAPFVSVKSVRPQDFLCQALTTNLGSICAGALVGFMSPLLWGLLRVFRRCERSKHKSVHRAAVRASNIVDFALRNSNKYTYCQVATKGKSWFTSATDTVRFGFGVGCTPQPTACGEHALFVGGRVTAVAILYASRRGRRSLR